MLKIIIKSPNSQNTKTLGSWPKVEKFILGVVQNRGCIPKNNPCNYISVIPIRTRPCVPVFVSVKLKISSLSIFFCGAGRFKLSDNHSIGHG